MHPKFIETVTKMSLKNNNNNSNKRFPLNRPYKLHPHSAIKNNQHFASNHALILKSQMESASFLNFTE